MKNRKNKRYKISSFICLNEEGDTKNYGIILSSNRVDTIPIPSQRIWFELECEDSPIFSPGPYLTKFEKRTL